MGTAEHFAYQLTAYLRDKSSVIICYDVNKDKVKELFEFCINNTADIINNKVMFILPMVEGLTIEIFNTLRNVNFIILPLPKQIYDDIKGFPSNIQSQEDLDYFIKKYSTESKKMISILFNEIKIGYEDSSGVYAFDIKLSNNKVSYHFNERIKAIKDYKFNEVFAVF
jgi:hypothetical protein